MADQAERGYDVDALLHRRKGGRPALGSAAASVESVRLDPELRGALLGRAAAKRPIQGVSQARIARNARGQDGAGDG